MAAGKGMTKAGGAEEKRSKAVPGSEIDYVAGFLANANKISDALQTIATDVDATITMTDWLLLHALSSEGSLPMTKAASRIGVTRQRVHQQSTPLQTAGLITIADGEGKTRLLSIAPAGSALHKKLEKTFSKALTKEEGNMPTGLIHNAKQASAKIARLLGPKRSEASKAKGAAASENADH